MACCMGAVGSFQRGAEMSGCGIRVHIGRRAVRYRGRSDTVLRGRVCSVCRTQKMRRQCGRPAEKELR
eukprot:6176040-Pleurochrysis_carterae.AAC.5